MNITVFVLLAFVSVSLASITYSFNQVQNNECVKIQQATCTPCTNDGKTEYYKVFTDDYDHVYSYEYSSPDCSSESKFNNYNIFLGSECEINSYSSCSIYYSVETIEYSYFELKISSLEGGLSATFLGDKSVVAKISNTQLQARAKSLEGLIVSNPSGRFRFDRLVSPTQYSSSFGIFSLGEVVTSHNFEFAVWAVSGNSTGELSLSPSYITLTPFISIAIADDNQYDFLYGSGGDMTFADVGTFDGVYVRNPYFGIHNITFFPEFYMGGEEYQANIVFQIDSNSHYFTNYCYHSQSTINNKEFDFYECQMGSLSFSFGSFSFGSFSGSFPGSFSGSFPGSFSGSFSLSFPFDLDRRPPTKPDHMAFSLF